MDAFFLFIAITSSFYLIFSISFKGGGELKETKSTDLKIPKQPEQ